MEMSLYNLKIKLVITCRLRSQSSFHLFIFMLSFGTFDHLHGNGANSRTGINQNQRRQLSIPTFTLFITLRII